jgi:uncharacterized protein
MVIYIADIREGISRHQYSIEPASLDLEECHQIPVPIDLQLVLTRSGEQIFVQGTVSFTARLVCARCLRPFDQQLSETLRVLVKRKSLAGAGTLSQEEEDDPNMIYHDGEEFNLTTPVRDLVLLTLPLKPLCREDCKGLCPHCGADLNREECTCQEHEIDPRWAVLKNL